MGRNNKKYQKTLHQQAFDRLRQMQAFGESKRADKATGETRDKIYSYATYQTYWKHIKYFLHWVQRTRPECTTLKAAKRHVNEWLSLRTDRGLSAWTIATEAAALNKLFGILPDDPGRFQPPPRRREDIRRSRVDVGRDRHFSETNNDELIKFCRATGARRNVLERLKGDDLWSRERMERRISELQQKETCSEAEKKELDVIKDALETFPDQRWYVYHHRDKGGRDRLAPILGPYADLAIRRMQETQPNQRVWYHVSANADIHAYRADYCAAVYKAYARPLNTIPYDRINKGTGRPYQSGVYHCKKDEKGKRLDKQAMLRASKALGHSRIDVIAAHYLYKL